MATITKRNGSYRIKVSLGYDSAGKQIIKSTTWKPESGKSDKQIEKELTRQAVLFEEKCKKGLVMDSNIKFGEFSEKWIKDYGETQLRPRTIARYKELLKRINRGIGHIKIENLRPHHLMEFYKNLSEESVREDTKYKTILNFTEVFKSLSTTKTKTETKIKTKIKTKTKTKIKTKIKTKTSFAKLLGVSMGVLNSCFKGENISYKSALKISKALNKKIDDIFMPCEVKKSLSPKTILHYHRLISVIMSTAVRWQLVDSNPCQRVKPPKVDKKEAKYLDEIETKRLVDCLKDENIRYKTMIEVLIYTGLRRGELCGLSWSDVDFENKLLNIDKSVLYLPERGIFEDSTKNQSSNRVIKVPDKVIDSLRAYKEYQQEQMLMLGSKWNMDNDKIFTSWDGGKLHPDTVSDWFKKFLKRHNLPNISIHSLRHTNATLMIANGVPIKTVSSRLGHSNISTTGNIYTHAIRSADEAAAQTLQNIFS